MAKEKMVVVTTPYERVVHWSLAGSCLLLVLTGLLMAFHSFKPLADILGGYLAVLWIHRIAGLVFTIFLFLGVGIWKKDAGSLDSSDIAWLKGAGGYLWDADIPAPYKYNAGQKLFFIVVALYGLVMVGTGILLWTSKGVIDASFMNWIMALHSFGVLVIGAFAMVHIYLGTIGTSGSLSAMTRGEVTEAWAKTHMTGWYNENVAKK